MQRARWMRGGPETKHVDLLKFAADHLYTKIEIDSLVVENKAWVEEQNAIAQEQNAIVVEQDAVVSELAAWVSRVSALVTPLSNSMVSKGNEQTEEESLPLETEQQQALVEQLAVLVSKLSDLASKQVDFEATKKNERTKQGEPPYRGEERGSLEEEKEALKAKAKKLGIEEEKLRTTTPEEFKKLIDAQEKLHDDLNTLYDEIEAPSDDKGEEEIAKLGRDFRAKTRETFFLMAANNKRISEAWDLLELMDSITSVIQHQSDFNDYYVKTVAMFLAEHMLEENQAKEETKRKEEIQDEKEPRVLEVTEGVPEVETSLVQEVHAADVEPRDKVVLQVQDGLQ
ncbi:hypothetical protein GMDG_07284 [Pseudogymnoascus destructans 20631-21]|uniref:Uncharacterized protein n=1 Tax=Pseudogymnoascus destructans (strain ATCC MYA-4855 / 20631-21) TaxID=658429 RepID=L8FZZ1_PSED2|nr:hypothetical protein GMDG_07284 [Pseudogymnoascus destructans 20631-21]